MEYLTGILLDVSGSMRYNIGKGTDEKGDHGLARSLKLLTT